MPDLVDVYHENGKKLRIPRWRLESVRKLGWRPKGEEVEEPEKERDYVSELNLNSSSLAADDEASASDPQESNSWQE